jgi:dipeptidyl aminopeptidase/acylaminoacyl peptidase
LKNGAGPRPARSKEVEMQGFRMGAMLALALATAPAGALGAGGDPPATKAAAPETPASGAADDPLLATLLVHGSFLSLALSPDGRHIAALLSDGRDTAVGLIDADTMEMRNIVEPVFVSGGKYEPHRRSPRHVAWVADDLLAVNFNDGASLVRLDGTPAGSLFDAWRLQIRAAGGALTDWAVVQREFDEPKHLSRFNVRSHENYSIDVELPGTLAHWTLDNRGELRLATTIDSAFWSDKSRLLTWMRDAGTDHWNKIDDRSIVDDAFQPLQFSGDSDRLIVQARNGGDRLAIWEYDPATHLFTRNLASDPDDDIVSELASADRTGLVTVVTGGLRPTFHWLDLTMARLQASLDASLPDHVNVMLSRADAPRMLVFSYSDRDPGRWYLFEPKAMKMKELVGSLPDIRPERMQPMRRLRYPSFDGTPIPAYLTLPGPQTGPAPMIVLIHGGPQARDSWQWDRDVQVFAAHGYAVFQPQFRGSTGFGRHFEEAGYGQWGQAMQDDITAGVQWLVDSKIADPQRICIVGASYGGYAALWGLVHTPELYKCGVSTSGVSDIGRMLKADSDTNASTIGRELLHSFVSDPARMKIPFDDVSPLKHADRIVAPLLLVHGKLDKRVPIEEGRAMLTVMQRLHKDVQWLEFDDEGHGIVYTKNLVAWYGAMFALFERTIGKGVPPLPPLLPATPPGPPAAASAPG